MRIARKATWAAALLWCVGAFAQTPPPVEGGHDYFTAGEDPGVQGYLRIIEYAHTGKILDWIRDGMIGNAVADAKYTLERFPNHPRGLQLMVALARITKDPSLPLPYFNAALKAFPQYAITHAQHGAYLVEIHDVDDGILELKRAIEMEPTLAVAHAWLSDAYRRKGELELAKRSAARARELGYAGDLAGDAPGASTP